MRPIFIGIPVLNRLDLLEQSIAAIDYPAEITVVNNNSIDDGFATELDRLSRKISFRVLHQSRNLGVAASWNLIIKTGFANGHDWIIINSNDTRLHPGSISSAIQITKDEDVAIWCLSAMNCFMLHKATIERVGWFDENFYPAYVEDVDYGYRCKLAALRMVDIPGAAADHVGSATINSNRDYWIHNSNTHFNWNLNHYIMKWGGNIGEERFATPYNDHSKDHRWWPDPGGSIAVRDWDNDVRESKTKANSKQDT